MSLSPSAQKIYDDLNKLFEIDAVKERIARLKQLNLNPFSLKTDGTPEGWDDTREAIGIIHDLALAGVRVAETSAAELKGVATGEDKLNAVAKYVDELIKLNFVMEMFDGPAIKFALSMIVNNLNKVLGKDWAIHVPEPE